MKFLKSIGTLFLSSTLAFGCWDFKDDTLEESKRSEINKLPLTSSFCQKADMNNDGLEDFVVAGPLEEDPNKVGIYFLENKKTHYQATLLHDEIPLRNASVSLIDLNGDELKDISLRGRTLPEKRRTHWKRFELINKCDFYVQE